MRLLPKFSASDPVAVVFVPSSRFLLRTIPLAPDVPATDQAALAVEGWSPFPLTQLYWGCCVAPGKDRALVYAAYRRRFDAAETNLWKSADFVVPTALALLADAPNEPQLRLLHEGKALTGVVWDGRTEWPVTILSREYPATIDAETRTRFAAELQARAGAADLPVSVSIEAPFARREAGALVIGWPGRDRPWRIRPHDQGAVDVRDPAFLAQRRHDRRRGEWAWRGLLAGAAAAIGGLMLDAGSAGLHWRERSQQARAERQRPVVARLEAANVLSGRVDALARRQSRFFEMLQVINESRPRSIQFTRVGSAAHNELEVEARTDRAEDVPAYESALRQLSTLARVEILGLRARDGQMVFGLRIAFKTDAVAGSGGAP